MTAGTPGRRELLWFAVTRQPTAEWLTQQIMEAFPWDTAPNYLLRDNDASYGLYKASERERSSRVTRRAGSWQRRFSEHLIRDVGDCCRHEHCCINECCINE